MVSQRHLEKSMANRESGLNVASRIDWAMRGERERKRRQRSKREDQEPRAEDQENQESAWPKWQGYTGKEKAGKESKASGLEWFKLGHGMETRQRSNMYGVRHVICC